ncbi:MAG: DUF6364 family protein [Candidatus Latescibacterota bacterium]|jgi:hypothetical protein
MKTKLTVTIDPDLLPVAKLYAKSQGKSLSSLIEDTLRELSASGGKSFSEQWTGTLRQAKHGDVRFEALSKKYL